MEIVKQKYGKGCCRQEKLLQYPESTELSFSDEKHSVSVLTLTFHDLSLEILIGMKEKN